MERTGHRSIEAVRSYKRTSKEQLEKVSDILNNGSSQKKRVPVMLFRKLLKILNRIILNVYLIQCPLNTLHKEQLQSLIYNHVHL